MMKIVERLGCDKVAGFYTEEIRKENKRKGFRWARLDGGTGTLAHVGIRGSAKVGKYGVNVASFERQVVPILDVEQSDAELFVIDEIGKMECFSEKFVGAVRRPFASEKTVLATVAQKGSGLIQEVKDYPDVRLFKLTSESRDETIEDILGILSSLQGSSS